MLAAILIPSGSAFLIAAFDPADLLPKLHDAHAALLVGGCAFIYLGVTGALNNPPARSREAWLRAAFAALVLVFPTSPDPFDKRVLPMSKITLGVHGFHPALRNSRPETDLKPSRSSLVNRLSVPSGSRIQVKEYVSSATGT